MPLNVILSIARPCVLRGLCQWLPRGRRAGLLLRRPAGDRAPEGDLPVGPPAQITDNIWAPNLLIPVILFLIIWQWRLRGRIGPSGA